MTIRVKLTLWYVCVLSASLLLCALLLYREWVIEPEKARRQRHEERERREKLEQAGLKQEGKEQGREKEHESDLEEDVVESLAENVLWIAIPAAILGLAGGWWLMRQTMAPVTALTKAAEQLNESNLKVQLPRSGSGDELDRLTAVFNDMSARLEASFRRIREFTLRASHELKTPLTVMRGSMETALAEPALTHEHKERLRDELDEVDRLAQIVDGLSLLTRADAGLITLKKDAVRLDALLREIYQDGQILARPHNVQVNLGEAAATTIAGDNNRLRQMLLNLVDNAVKYNAPGGSVTLSLRHARDRAELAVANTGAGVPEEMLPHLFDPFFRVDKSHTRAVDGCGLGLAIVHWIVTAHGGTVEITSEPGGPTTATVRLPLMPDLPGDAAKQ